MSETEFFERAINRICKDYDGEFAFEFESIFKKKDKEIERLHSIIKEVREYIKQNEFYLDYKTGACIKGVMALLEILDKENKEC